MISPAAILSDRVTVTLPDGRIKERPACVFGPLAVAMHRDGDVTSWIVVHVASGREISEAAVSSGTHAMVMVGALLALPIDWRLQNPLEAGSRMVIAVALHHIKELLQ